MPSLKLVLSPPALQRLHEALSCLAKFSEYVTIEATRNNLTLVALNSSKSAHGAVNLLGGRFFDTYHFATSSSFGRSLEVEESKFQCRLHTKALLSVFRQRYLDSKDKDTAIEKCEMMLGEAPTHNEYRLLIKLICKHGVVKIHKLAYEDVDVMHAVFDRNTAGNRWIMNAKLLKEYMEHFGPKAEQLDISRKDMRATLTSYTEKLMDGIEILKQPLHTAVSMDTIEFEEFSVEEGLHITISLKDFKAIVNHADSLNATISAYYSDPGRPLQLQYDRDGMNCEFTLMTTGSGGKKNPEFTRIVARSVPNTSSSRQQMNVPNQTPPAINVLESRDDDDPMQPPELAPYIAPEIVRQQVIPAQETLGQVVSQQVVEAAAQPVVLGLNAGLSLFLETDESMDDDEEHEDDVLGWDVDMDSSRRTGPTVTQQGQVNRQPPPGGEDNSDMEESDLLVGPTQEVSQARGLFD